MSYKETIESFIYDYPILEFHYLDRKDLIFSEKVRFLCEHECEHYGHSWACPPAIGSIESCIKNFPGLFFLPPLPRWRTA